MHHRNRALGGALISQTQFPREPKLAPSTRHGDRCQWTAKPALWGEDF